jgi:integrase
MLTYHYNRKKIASPPPTIKIIETIEMKHKRKNETPNAAYTPAQLQLLFTGFAENPAKRLTSTSDRRNHTATVYGCLLALYTGHRTSDLSYLKAADFDFTATIPNLLQENQLLVGIAPEGHKIAKMTNKTSNSLRIPLHKHLITIGLQKFIAKFKPDEKPFKKMSTVNQHLNAQLKLLGIKQVGQLAHSFRATLDNKHVALATPHDLKEIMMGHAIGGTAKHYTDPDFICLCELPLLNTYVQKVDFGINLSILAAHLREQLSFFK